MDPNNFKLILNDFISKEDCLNFIELGEVLMKVRTELNKK
jgi:hypothetical protein